jgi:hypothetical protein
MGAVTISSRQVECLEIRSWSLGIKEGKSPCLRLFCLFKSAAMDQRMAKFNQDYNRKLYLPRTSITQSVLSPLIAITQSIL